MSATVQQSTPATAQPAKEEKPDPPSLDQVYAFLNHHFPNQDLLPGSKSASDAAKAAKKAADEAKASETHASPGVAPAGKHA